MLIVALCLSATFEIIEYGLLNTEYLGYHRLRTVYMVKLVLVIPMICLSVALVCPIYASRLISREFCMQRASLRLRLCVSGSYRYSLSKEIC
jgi:hypothetical protein